MVRSQGLYSKIINAVKRQRNLGLRGLLRFVNHVYMSNQIARMNSPVLTCKLDWGRIRPVQILWSIALKLQIGEDDDKKESKYQKYIY